MSQFRKVLKNSTVYLMYTVNDSTGAAVDPSDAFEAADFRIYKNGGATQRASASGITATGTFDTVTGLGLLAIDLSDNADAGFYAVGGQYEVVLVPDTETVDGVAVVAKIGSFEITSGVEYYPDGAIHVDSVAGTAGTTAGVNGTPGNPVASLADALTLASAMGFGTIKVAPGSSLTAAGAISGLALVGDGWTLALGGQAANGTVIRGATVSGVFVGTPVFVDCEIGAITGAGAKIRNSAITGTLTANAAGTWELAHCWQGGATPTFDAGVAVANSTFRALNYAGDLNIANLGDAGTDDVLVTGAGEVILAASCDGGTLVAQGVWEITDNSGNVTIDSGGRIAPDNVLSAVSVEPTAKPVLGTSDMKAVLEWLGMLNLTKIKQTSVLFTVRDIADTVDVATAAYNDDGTMATRAAMS